MELSHIYSLTAKLLNVLVCIRTELEPSRDVKDSRSNTINIIQDMCNIYEGYMKTITVRGTYLNLKVLIKSDLVSCFNLDHEVAKTLDRKVDVT